MKALFLGGFAATVAPRILAKVETAFETEILADDRDARCHAASFAAADIVVGHIWRSGFPSAPRLRLLQSVAAGLDLLDLGASPKGVTVCLCIAFWERLAGEQSEDQERAIAAFEEALSVWICGDFGCPGNRSHECCHGQAHLDDPALHTSLDILWQGPITVGRLRGG